MFVTAHCAKLGTWVLAKLYQGDYFKSQYSMRLQGAPPA